ncbi:unnamed protein product [Hanseniaspora opuntiae]
MDNQQAFDILNGSTNDTLNESHLSSANGDFNNEPNTPTHKQYRPSSSAGASSSGGTNRIRRNGSMRRSLLFVSGSGMQIPSPSANSSSAKSPYANTRLSQSSEVLPSSQRRDNLSPATRDVVSPVGRIRAYSQGTDEMIKEIEKSPEQTKIQLSENTQHPLIVTKNSSKGANRYLTPTPMNPNDLHENKSASSSPIVSGNIERKHSRRTSSFSSRSLLMTPNTSTNINSSVKKNLDYQNMNMLDNSNAQINDNSSTLGEESVIKDNEYTQMEEKKTEEEDPSAKLFSKLAFKEAQILESKAELEELKKKVKSKEEQIKEEEAQLEALKQEMATELLKKHEVTPQQGVSKMSEILGLRKRSPPITNSTSEIMETSFSEELKFPSNTQSSKKEETFMDKVESGMSHQGLFDSEVDLDDVVYSLNSPQKKPIDKREFHNDVPDYELNNNDSTIDKMLDTNFPLKENTPVIKPAGHRGSQSISVARDMPNRKNMPQRSKSRMSMYFSKTVSLMSQFDQILQNELEKKMGLDEETQIDEEKDEEIMDLPPRPDEIDNMQSEQVPKKTHARTLSSYRFFG